MTFVPSAEIQIPEFVDETLGRVMGKGFQTKDELCSTLPVPVNLCSEGNAGPFRHIFPLRYDERLVVGWPLASRSEDGLLRVRTDLHDSVRWWLKNNLLTRDEYDGLPITGPYDFIPLCQETLDYLKDDRPDEYEYVRRHITEIIFDGHSRVEPITGRFHVGPKFRRERNKIALTRALIHEARHVEQARGIPNRTWHYLLGSQEDREIDCVKRTNEFLVSVGYPPINLKWVRNDKHWLTPIEQMDW